MNQPDQRILEFINEHHVLNLASCSDNQPYMAHCFYVYLKKINAFVFTSDEKTRHGQEMLLNAQVAAGIPLETKTIGKIQGLQMTGVVRQAKDKDVSMAKKAYLKAYPYAVLHLETMWILYPDFYKFTDNRLGFGKKLIWGKIVNKSL